MLAAPLFKAGGCAGAAIRLAADWARTVYGKCIDRLDLFAVWAALLTCRDVVKAVTGMLRMTRVAGEADDPQLAVAIMLKRRL